MRVVIDGHTLGTGAGGNETYVRGLIEGFLQLQEPFNLIVCSRRSSRSPNRPGFQSIPRGVRYLADQSPAHSDAEQWCSNEALEFVRLRSRGPIVRLLFEFPRLLSKLEANVGHFQYAAPIFSPCPIVLSVHDASYALEPRLLGRALATRLRLTMPLMLRRAAAVIAPSRWTADQLRLLVPSISAMIFRVPLGVSSRFLHSGCGHDEEATRCALNLPPRYLLYVGRRERRKNVGWLVSVYHEALKRDPTLPALLLVGPACRGDVALRRELATRGISDRVQIVGHLPETAMPAVYRGARFFCYPARLEGFGLPVLEAMACGRVVIANNEGAIPETLGGAGILCAPHDREQWIAALLGLHGNGERRRMLAARGHRRALARTWVRTARATLDVYERVASPCAAH